MDSYNANGSQNPGHSHSHSGASNLPPLSLSILGVEPLDEFIKEIADFVHHMIVVRAPNYPPGNVEVEAKVGVLRDRSTGKRLEMPVLVETSSFFHLFILECVLIAILAGLISISARRTGRPL